MNWTVWEQGADRYHMFGTKAEALTFRVGLLDAWRKDGSGRTAVKHFRTEVDEWGRVHCASAWTEADGWDLQRRAQSGYGSVIVDFVNLFPARDR